MNWFKGAVRIVLNLDLYNLLEYDKYEREC